MFLDKKSLAAARVTAAEDGRYILSCVHAEPDGTTVGTNGRAIVAVSPPDAKREDFPDVGPMPKAPKDGLNLSPQIVKDLRRALPKGRAVSARPILGNAALVKAPKGHVAFATTDLSSSQRIEGAVPEGRFPDWQSMIAPIYSEANRVSVFLNPNVLGAALRAMSDVIGNATETRTVEIRFSTQPVRPVLLRGRGTGGRNIVAVVAPVGVRDGDSGKRDVSDWEKKIVGAVDVARAEYSTAAKHGVVDVLHDMLGEIVDCGSVEGDLNAAEVGELCGAVRAVRDALRRNGSKSRAPHVVKMTGRASEVLESLRPTDGKPESRRRVVKKAVKRG